MHTHVHIHINIFYIHLYTYLGPPQLPSHMHKYIGTHLGKKGQMYTLHQTDRLWVLLTMLNEKAVANVLVRPGQASTCVCVCECMIMSLGSCGPRMVKGQIAVERMGVCQPDTAFLWYLPVNTVYQVYLQIHRGLSRELSEASPVRITTLGREDHGWRTGTVTHSRVSAILTFSLMVGKQDLDLVAKRCYFSHLPKELRWPQPKLAGDNSASLNPSAGALGLGERLV